MNPFLKTVSAYLLSSFPQGLDKVCMVFPNKRAALYLNKYLADALNQPVWAPHYSTISELMREISGLAPGDQLILQYELYKVYSQIHTNPESFEQFYNWGLTILSDFDDIDKYQVDASKLFQNLSDLKEIEERFDFLTDEQKEIIRSFWGNARLDHPSPLKAGFLNFWQELGKVYDLFRSNLRNRKLAYEGMIYKEVASKIKGEAKIPLPYDAYCFVGFNALNECEKVLFDFFRKSGKAVFFWDYDEYYIGNTWHEAGLFLRENIKRYPSPVANQKTAFFSGKKKKIHIIAANNDVAQAKVLPQIVEHADPGLKTCVVLSDESLLIPVLSSLPDSVPRVNITMGYPFSNSPAFTLLEIIIRLFRSVRKDQELGRLFYRREMLALLRHPYIQQVFPTESGKIADLVLNENRIYLQGGDLKSIPVIHELLECPEAGIAAQFSALIREIADRLDHNSGSDPLDIQYLLSLYSQSNKLLNLVKEEKIELQPLAYLRFLRQLARRIKVSFIGEPLTDFQVLGVLETRLLDFEHVIMLSVNEGILPAKEQGNSFIPYTLRKALGMPTIEYHDAIYAYYFYRFIQRAGQITMIYNARAGSLQSGEMSRFLYQLKYDDHFEVEEKALTFRISVPSEVPVSVAKDERLLQFARDHTFTPTSLNTWLTCSLKFYFQFLEGLKEKEEVSEDVDASQFGRLLHHAMHQLYLPFESKLMKAEDIRELYSGDKLENAIDSAFETIYPSRGKHTWKLNGKNLIIRKIVQKYILKILETDQEYAPFELIAVEKKIEREFRIPSLDHSVKIGGYVDRIDYKNGTYRIIDYKTGEVTPNFTDIESLFRSEKRKTKDAALQCLIYAYVLMETYPDGAIQAGLFSVKKMFSKDFNYLLRITKGETISDIRIYKQELMERLEELLIGLFNAQPFTKTEDVQACLNCDYRHLCHRG